MEDLLAISSRPAISIRPDATVRDAAVLMAERHIGALVVLDDKARLVGILSERDVLARVVARRQNPDATPVSEIMTRQVQTAQADQTTDSALTTMLAGHFRHLPIVDGAGAVVGMLSVRDLLREQVGELARHNADLVNYISADGAGG